MRSVLSTLVFSLAGGVSLGLAAEIGLLAWRGAGPVHGVGAALLIGCGVVFALLAGQTA